VQRHEGPRRDPGADERARQAGLTRHLLIAIGILAALVAAALAYRLF
jgi:hypothetical protein